MEAPSLYSFREVCKGITPSIQAKGKKVDPNVASLRWQTHSTDQTVPFRCLGIHNGNHKPKPE